MSRDLTFVKAGCINILENIELEYYAPLFKNELEEIVEDYDQLSVNELKALHERKINVKIKVDNRWNSEPQYFYAKDGRQDVFTKDGDAEEEVSVLANQTTYSYNFRIYTTDTNIDFIVNGKIKFGDKIYIITKIIYDLGNTFMQNKIYALGNTEVIRKFAPKYIDLE